MNSFLEMNGKDIMDIVLDYKNSMEQYDNEKLEKNKVDLKKTEKYYNGLNVKKRKENIILFEKLEDNMRILKKNIFIYEKRLRGEYNRIDSNYEIIKE